MNVFDDEMGPLADQEEAQRLILLVEAGVTIQEYWAYIAMMRRGEAAN